MTTSDYRHCGALVGFVSCYYYRYVGSDKETPLNRFLMDHHGKPGVVILDEADKLGEDSWIALMNIFEKGVYQWEARCKSSYSSYESSSTKKVDCSKVIFVLTANFIDNEIEWFENECHVWWQRQGSLMRVLRHPSKLLSRMTFGNTSDPSLRPISPGTWALLSHVVSIVSSLSSPSMTPSSSSWLRWHSAPLWLTSRRPCRTTPSVSIVVVAVAVAVAVVVVVVMVVVKVSCLVVL